MKIEFENNMVTLKMTADEAQSLHCLFFKAINDLKAKKHEAPDVKSDQEGMLAMLSAFDDRLYDAFYKYQRN